MIKFRQIAGVICAMITCWTSAPGDLVFPEDYELCKENCCTKPTLIPSPLMPYLDMAALLDIQHGIYEINGRILICIYHLDDFSSRAPAVAANIPEASNALNALIQWNRSLNEALKKNEALWDITINALNALIQWNKSSNEALKKNEALCDITINAENALIQWNKLLNEGLKKNEALWDITINAENVFDVSKESKSCLKKIYELFNNLSDVLKNATIISNISSFYIKQITDAIDPKHLWRAQDAQESAPKLEEHTIELKKYHEQLKTLYKKALNSYHVDMAVNDVCGKKLKFMHRAAVRHIGSFLRDKNTDYELYTDYALDNLKPILCKNTEDDNPSVSKSDTAPSSSASSSDTPHTQS